jgi:hypothetical protein
MVLARGHPFQDLTKRRVPIQALMKELVLKR